jgi:hypothetical protein
MEIEICRFFHETPMQIGERRRKDPAGIRFIEKKILWECKEREKQQKEIERKAKSGKKGRKH